MLRILSNLKSRAGRVFSLKACLVFALLGLSGLCVTVWLGGGSVVGGQIGLSNSLRSSQFRLFLTVALLCIFGIGICGGLLWRAGLPWRKKMTGQAGTVLIEFTLILPIALMLVLLMVQSSLLMGAHLCVTYAGYCAARSAIVQIPKDYTDKGGAPRNEIYDTTAEASEKFWHIKYAAVWAVMPISDGNYYRISKYTDTLQAGIASMYSQYDKSNPKWTEYLGHKLAYAEDNTTVELSEPAVDNIYGEHEDIKVKVSHNIYLAVPYANVLLTKLDSEHAVELGDGKYALKVETACTLTNEGVPEFIDFEVFPKED